MTLDIDQDFFDNWIQAINTNQEFIKISNYLNLINNGSINQLYIIGDISLNGYNGNNFLNLEFDKDIELANSTLTINTDLNLIISRNFLVNANGGGGKMLFLSVLNNINIQENGTLKFYHDSLKFSSYVGGTIINIYGNLKLYSYDDLDYSNGRFVLYDKGILSCNTSSLLSCVLVSLIYNPDIKYIVSYGKYDVDFANYAFILTNPNSYVSSIINKEIKETFDNIKSPENSSTNANINSLDFAKLRKLLLYIIWILENHYHIKIHKDFDNLAGIEK